MNIIVTGGAGFIGSNFVFHMLKKYPDYRIICLDKLTYAGNLSTLAPVMDNPNFLFVKTVEQHQHRKIACLEEIAYLNGWISKDELMEVYEVMKKNQYGQYLKDVMDGKYKEHLY